MTATNSKGLQVKYDQILSFLSFSKMRRLTDSVM